MSTRVELLIDELILHGFAHAERYAIGEALQQELQQLIAVGDAGKLATLKSAARLRVGNMTLGIDAKPAAVGAQIAQAVHGGLFK